MPTGPARDLDRRHTTSVKGHGVLTPEEIQSREFLVSLRGYDRDEVHAFLDEVAEAFSQLLVDGGAERAAAAEDTEAAEPVAAPEPAAEPAPVPAAAVTPAEPAVSPFAAIGAETQRILEAAQSAGEEIRRRAQDEADQARATALAEAEREVGQLRDQAAATQGQIEVLLQRRDELGERLRQARETVDLALLELDDSEVEPEPADATNSVLAADADADADTDVDAADEPDTDEAVEAGKA